MWQSVYSGVKWWKVSNGLREHVAVSVQWSEYCSVVKDCRQRTWVMRFRRRCIQHDLAAPVLSWCTRSTTSPAQKCDRRIILHPLTQPSVLWHCWLGVRKSTWPVKIEWWGAGVVICLERCADCLHIMVQLMLLHPKTSSSLASFKSRLVLSSFWYRPRLFWKRSR